MAGQNTPPATDNLGLDQFELQAFQWYHVEKVSLRQMTIAFQSLLDQITRGLMTIDVGDNQWRSRLKKWRARWKTEKTKRGEEIDAYPKHLEGLKLYYRYGHALFDALYCMADCAQCLPRAKSLQHSIVSPQGYPTGLQPLSYEVSNPTMLGNSQTHHPLQSQWLPGANSVRVWTPFAQNPSAEHQGFFNPAAQSSLHHSLLTPNNYIPSGPTIIERSHDNISAFAYPQTLEATGLLGGSTTSEGYAPTPAANSSTVQYYEHLRRSQGPENPDQRLNNIHVPGTAWPSNTDPVFPSYG